MKIAVNTRLLIKTRMEGIARYNYESLKRMVLAHPEDQFYFIFDRPYSDDFIFAENVTPIRVFPPTRHPIILLYWLEWALPRKLKEINPDVFLSGDTYLSLRSKYPTVLVSHDLAYLHYPDHIPWDHRLYYKIFFPLFHRKAKALISVSQYTKEDIIYQYGIDSQKITVAHNAPNGHFYSQDKETQDRIRKELTGGRPYFVYLGSIHPRKNLVNLIKAFDLFKEQSEAPYCLLIIGRPAWNTDEFYKALEESPYKKDIIHRQFERSVLPQYIGSSEALCYISLFEGFGIPILEGFEAGVPVITSNKSSMPEVAGDAALLADPSKPDSIKDQMMNLYQNSSLKNELVKKGKKRLEAFSWDNTAKILYDKLVEVFATK